ncbi:MAG: cell division protein ZapA [Spirochaetes bacterium]|nr:cell division protein ZapA [Spirochaetota bacterium]
MAQQNRVKVEILNQVYTINGDASPEYILQLADYINTKIRELNMSSASSSPMQAAILAALNIADEYFQLKKIQNSYEGVLEKKTSAIISMLDDGLIGDTFSRINA